VIVELLAALEQSAAARLLKTSFYVYPVVNAVHIAAIGTLFTSVWLMDLRVLGFFGAIPASPFLSLLRRVAFGAFMIALLSGFALFSVRASDYAAMPVFLAKICLILLAGCNLGLFLLMGRTRSADLAPTTSQKVAGGLSAILWTATLLAGRFIGFS
jgi:hypothetical protein